MHARIIALPSRVTRGKNSLAAMTEMRLLASVMQVIVHEKDDWPYFCSILQGNVQVRPHTTSINFTRCVQVSRCKQGEMGMMGPGQWFGDLCATSSLAKATVKTATECLLTIISCRDFDVICTPPLTPMSPKKTTTSNVRLEDIEFMDAEIGSGSFGKVESTHRCQ